MSKHKLIAEIQRKFSKVRKPENLANVLIAGKELLADSRNNGKNRWEFVSKGATPYAVDQAFKKYRLLERKEAPRIRILKYMREKAPTTETGQIRVLKFERENLYAHLANSIQARQTAASALKTEPTLSAIKNKMESGTVMQQIDKYDTVYNNLVLKKQYRKSFNYVMFGFRFLPDKYWLSDLALKILSKC